MSKNNKQEKGASLSSMSEDDAQGVPVSIISVTRSLDGFYKEAEALEKALKLAPENDEIEKNLSFAYVKIAIAKFLLGYIEESMEKLTKALELDPGSDKAKEILLIVRLESAKTTLVEPIMLASASNTSLEDGSSVVLAGKEEADELSSGGGDGGV